MAAMLSGLCCPALIDERLFAWMQVFQRAAFPGCLLVSM
jgi:hypothetical protein